MKTNMACGQAYRQAELQTWKEPDNGRSNMRPKSYVRPLPHTREQTQHYPLAATHQPVLGRIRIMDGHAGYAWACTILLIVSCAHNM